MRLLLDTHAFIWWVSDPVRLSPRALSLCRDPANELVLSVVSAWEMQVKIQLGKLRLAAPLTEIIAQEQSQGLSLLTVRLEHVAGLDRLPLLHRDPFDRMLIAQAVTERLTVLTRDEAFASYEVRKEW